MLHITQGNNQNHVVNIHRVIWCPFIPEEDESDDDNSMLLVLTHGKKGNKKLIETSKKF